MPVRPTGQADAGPRHRLRQAQPHTLRIAALARAPRAWRAPRRRRELAFFAWSTPHRISLACADKRLLGGCRDRCKDVVRRDYAASAPRRAPATWIASGFESIRT